MHEIDELTSMKQERITDAQNLIAAINDIKYRLGLDITEKEVNMIPCL
jgi:glucose-6-phosphate dehydrogenase assembly protein OpcA